MLLQTKEKKQTTIGKPKKIKLNIFSKMFEALGRVGKALLFPIAVLPIAAIINRLAAQLPANSGIANAPAFVEFIQSILKAVGDTVFNNLYLLFAVGVGFGLTKDNRGEAALTALVSIILLNLLMSRGGADLTKQIYGNVNFNVDPNTIKDAIDSGQMPPEALTQHGFIQLFGNSYDKILGQNVLNGILCGCFVAFIYNRFNNIELPKVLGFFSGRRLVPVLTILGMMVFGVLYAIIFPWFGFVLYQISIGLKSASGNRWSNAAISGIYVFINRLLIPFGLHHVPNTLFWFVLGQQQSASGSGLVYGDINGFLNGAALGNTSGTFQTGFFPMIMFGLPALVYVFYKNAESNDQKQKVLSVFIPLALIAFLTGITEPIEFAFMFVSPLLYLIYASLGGIFSFIVTAFGIQLGFGFSAGLIDYLLSIPKSIEIIKANKSGIDAILSNPGWLIPIGLACSISCAFIGNLVVKKFNLPTPGRGDNLITNEMTKKESQSKSNNLNGEMQNFSNKSKKIVLGLGGWENIENYQNCTTRLRYDVKDMSKVNEQLLKEGGAIGTKKFHDHHIQVIIGPQAEIVNDEIIKNKNSDLTILGENISNNNEKNETILKKPIIFKSPVNGKVIKLSKMSDEAFNLMGEGIAIIPSSNKFTIYDESKIENVFYTGHAYIVNQGGFSILIHIGIDTNKINENKKENEKLIAFDSDYLNSSNQLIKKNSLLVDVNLKKIKDLGYDTTTAIVALNECLDKYKVELFVKDGQTIKAGESLFEIKSK